MAVTIQCETCGITMTFGDDMRGLSAPCTHCQRQVVIPDPESAVDGAVASAKPASAISHTGHPAEAQVDFNVNPTEADSIFVNPEAVSEDLFGRAEVFDPASFTAVGDAPLPLPDLIVAPENVPPPTTVSASSMPPGEPTTRPDDSLTPPEPSGQTADVAPPWLMGGTAAAAGMATTEASENGDATWVQQDEAPAPTTDQHWESEVAAQAPVDEAALALRAMPRPRAKIPASFWVLSILVPYALAATAFAMMLFVRTPPRNQHPLESLIDQGVYEEGRQQFIENPKRELPPDLKPLRLNEARTIGDLEITPLEVLHQRVKFRYKEGVRDRLSDEEMLVLRLRLKNASHPPVIFHPNDPTFVRGDKDAYSYLEIGQRRFYSPVGNLHTERIEGQSFDELLPDATMETVCVAAQEISGSPENILAVVKKLSPTDPLLWRVQLRKGQERLESKGKTKLVWATTVVPIAFSVSDIKDGNASRSGVDEEKKADKEKE